MTVGQTLAVEWPILDVLSEDERQGFLRACRRRRFARNEVIFHEGDPGDTLHLIARGHVAVPRDDPTRRHRDAAGPRAAGEFFGELAVVSPAARNATAVAIDAVETLARPP